MLKNHNDRSHSSIPVKFDFFISFHIQNLQLSMQKDTSESFNAGTTRLMALRTLLLVVVALSSNTADAVVFAKTLKLGVIPEMVPVSTAGATTCALLCLKFSDCHMIVWDDARPPVRYAIRNTCNQGCRCGRNADGRGHFLFIGTLSLCWCVTDTLAGVFSSVKSFCQAASDIADNHVPRRVISITTNDRP